MSYPFLKGHGTENDFVLLPDHDGSTHGDLRADRVRALCDRRAGIGGDGVLRVVRTAVLDPAQAGSAEWFMDYRNADGSVGEMCGNGVRVFALHLLAEGLVRPGDPVAVATRSGTRTVSVDGDLFTADMGVATVLGDTTVEVRGRQVPARHVDLGNPHAVAWWEDLAGLGPTLEQPGYDATLYPTGVNVELVARRGERHVAMRVHERGVGETRSCGTGACAVAATAALADGNVRGAAYRVDVPGGTLSLTWLEDGRMLMTGPAVIVARGTTDL